MEVNYGEINKEGHSETAGMRRVQEDGDVGAIEVDSVAWVATADKSVQHTAIHMVMAQDSTCYGY